MRVRNSSEIPRDYDISSENITPVFADSPARKTRNTRDFPINQCHRALKRYNVILAANAREDTGRRARERKRKTKRQEITRLHLSREH